MRYMKYGIIVIFIIVTVIFTFNWYEDKRSTDHTAPEIQISSNLLEVSVKATEEEMLEGVVAKDAKDGDLTAKVVIESISKFIDKKEHICNITYAVADSNNNVAKRTRKIKFTDYESPKFTLSKPLVFNIRDEMDLVGLIGAEDVFDGDISGRVKVLSSSATTYEVGKYAVTIQVTNSLGDTSKLKTVVHVEEENTLEPQIVLSKNIVYLKKGRSFKAEKYIKSAKDHEENSIDNSKVSVTESSVNTKKAGTYSVEYTVQDENEIEGKAYLVVVVEG